MPKTLSTGPRLPLRVSQRMLAGWVLGVALGLCFVREWVYTLGIIQSPFPWEYREGATPLTTALLLAGKNPFDLAHLPAAANVYGVLSNLITYPFAALFGATLPLHRAVSTGFIAACCGLYGLALRRANIPPLWTAAGVAILYAYCLYNSALATPPNSLGLFLFLGSALIPWLEHYSRRSLIWSGLLGTLAIYAKLYFGVAMPLLALYLLLFHSWRRALAYGAFCLGAIALSVGVTRFFFEAYFNTVLLIHSNVATYSVPHLMAQLKTLAILHPAFLLALGVGLWQGCGQVGQRLKRGGQGLGLAAGLKGGLTDAPGSMHWILGVAIALFLLFVGKLGGHVGNYLTYFLHLVAPFMLLAIFRWVSTQPKGLQAVFSLALAVNVWVISSDQLLYPIQRDLAPWRRVEQWVQTHPQVLNSPAIAPLLMAEHKPVYNSGHSEYFVFSFLAQPSPLLDRLFVGQAAIEARYRAFVAEIRDRVMRQEFDLVVLQHSAQGDTPEQRYLNLPQSVLQQSYRLEQVITVPLLYGQDMPLGIWTPLRVAPGRPD
jgi:hypothetical protein